MTYHVSGDLATSAVLFAQRMGERLKAEKDRAAPTRKAETERLIAHKAASQSKAEAAAKMAPRPAYVSAASQRTQKTHQIKLGSPESIEVAKKATALLKQGHNLRDAAQILGFSNHNSLRYHLSTDAVPIRSTKIHISRERMEEAIKRLKKETWQDVAASLGIARPTLVDKVKKHKAGLPT